MIVFGLFLCLLLGVNADSDSDKRIVGGKVTTINQHNYHVAIRANSTYVCGGSILSERHVLTAAHCVYLYTYYAIRYGTSYRVTTTGTLVDVTNIYIHNDYRVVQLSSGDVDVKGDIAIFKLKNAIIFSNSANKISLPEPNYEPTPGLIATLTGWGLEYIGQLIVTNQLKKASLPIMRNEDCANLWSPNTIYTTNICASANGDDSACNGDSGGGLVLNGKVIGITSWALRSCVAGANSKPVVFTRVSKYVAWIQDQLKK